MRRFIIEFGLGTDFHGQDVNKAAQKAVRDAMSRCCLCGLSEVLGISDFNKDVKVNVTVAVSKPDLSSVSHPAGASPCRWLSDPPFHRGCSGCG